MYRDSALRLDASRTPRQHGLASAGHVHLPHSPARDLELPFAVPRKLEATDELIAAVQPHSPHADAMRDLRNDLLEAFPSRTFERPVPVLSAERQDGKTYLAANLAVSLAEHGKVLLVDANMRTPRLHAIFSVAPDVGLSDLLYGQLDAAAVHTFADLPGLHFMAAGGSYASPLELLHAPRFGTFLAEVVRRFDAVILDTPADAQAPDARVIAARAGAALLIGRRGRSRIAPLQTLADKLRRSRTMITGLVLNEH